MTEPVVHVEQDRRPPRLVVMPWPRLLSIELLARYLSISPLTVRNHSGEIPGRRKVGRKVVFDRLVIDGSLEGRRENDNVWVAFRRAMR